MPAIPDAYCVTCGIVAPKEQLVHHSGDEYCPWCAPRKRVQWHTVSEWIGIVFFAAPLLILWLVGDESYGLEDGTIFLLGGAVFVALITLHELGHGLMAVLTGRRLLGIVVGHGAKRLGRIRLLDVVLELRLNMTGGTTYAAGRSGRLGTFLYYLGGVLAEAAVAAAAWAWDPTDASGEFVRAAILLFAAFDIVNSLWPRLIHLPPYGWVPNDGKLVLSLFTDWDGDQVIEHSVDDIEFAMWAETADAGEALIRAAADFAATPDRELTRYRLGNLLVAERQWDAAVVTLSPLESWSEISDWERGHLLNNLAWSALMLFDEARLHDACRWSGEAAELAPVLPAVSSTRGAALVMAGRPEEAIPLLVRAYRTCGGEPRDLALVSGFGAIATELQGDRTGMLQRYAAMIEHDPDCEIRRQVERRLSEAGIAAFADFVVAGDDERLRWDDDATWTLVVASARLTLNRLNGVSGGERLDDHEAPVAHVPFGVGELRARARGVLARELASTVAPGASAVVA